MASKPTKRKAFNFLRSYFDVLNELKDDGDKLSFLISIINKQFLDQDPEGLNFISNLCYESQRHQIESSVNGWKRANKTTCMTDVPTTPTTTPTTTPKEEEEKEEEKEKEEYIIPDDFVYSNFELKNFNWRNIKPIEKQLQDELINLWAEEKEVVKHKHYLKQLPEGDTELYLQIRSTYTKQDVRHALKALLQQKKIFHKLQHADPNYFLRNFNKWIAAYNNEDLEIYLKKEKINKL